MTREDLLIDVDTTLFLINENNGSRLHLQKQGDDWVTWKGTTTG